MLNIKLSTGIVIVYSIITYCIVNNIYYKKTAKIMYINWNTELQILYNGNYVTHT